MVEGTPGHTKGTLFTRRALYFEINFIVDTPRCPSGNEAFFDFIFVMRSPHPILEYLCTDVHISIFFLTFFIRKTHKT